MRPQGRIFFEKMIRPDFENIKTFDEFCSYYWYREELVDLCKKLGIEYTGGKAELYQFIRSYFDGVKILHKPKAKQKKSVEELTLETSLVECGFTFGPRFRDFYINVTGDENFKFNTDMVATAKAVKTNQDLSFTLGDLLDIKNGIKTYAVYDKSFCQWNRFLKDFCSDEINDAYPDKFKTACKFWAILRESNLPKVYSREFILSNRDKIE